MNTLQLIQNKAAKVILDVPFYSSSTDALRTLGWMTLEQRRKFHRCIAVYKHINGLIDLDFNFSLNKDIHNYNTKFKNNVHLGKVKRNWGKHTVNFKKLI